MNADDIAAEMLNSANPFRREDNLLLDSKMSVIGRTAVIGFFPIIWS